MNNTEHIYGQTFKNGWSVDIKYNENGFSDMYATDFKYSVMCACNDFTSFHNLKSARDCVDMIVEVMNY